MFIQESIKGMTKAEDGRYLIKIIGCDIQGSSAFYPREVIERDIATAFPAGTKIYFDHSDEEGVRSVRDIAGKITGGHVIREDGAYAEVQFNKVAQPIIEDCYDVIGMSIRGKADVIENESGIVVSKLHYHRLNSVDLVSEAGADGGIVQRLKESFNGKETVVEEKDITAIVSAVVDALKPAPADETEAVDLAAVTEAAIEAGLPKAARAKVVAAVKAGSDVEEAIKVEKAYIAQIAEDAVKKKVEPVIEGKVIETAASTVTEDWKNIAERLVG